MDIFVEATDAQCVLPPKSGGRRRRSTRKGPKKHRRTYHRKAKRTHRGRKTYKGGRRGAKYQGSPRKTGKSKTRRNH